MAPVKDMEMQLEGNAITTNNGSEISPMEVGTHVDENVGNSENAKPGLKAWVQKTLWHGGSNYDAWCNAVSGQV
jgi:hypothetical protein